MCPGFEPPTTSSHSASSRNHVTSQFRLLTAVIDGPQQMWAKRLSVEREKRYAIPHLQGLVALEMQGFTGRPGCYAFPNKEESHKKQNQFPVLAAKLELLSKALTDANTKNAAIWTKVDKELSSLNENLALSTPGQLAGKKVIQLSDSAIKTATASLVDRRVSESRLIIWGSFSRKIMPTKQAQSLLGSVLSKPDYESLHADWLRQKRSQRTLGLLITLSSPSAVQKILGRAVSIQKANPAIRRLSEDRPLDARKLGHSSSRKEVRKRLPDGASSAGPKLKAKPIVVIAPCAPGSTPRQATATPDSSFYSTTADPRIPRAVILWRRQASRGRSAKPLLSALLSVTDDKGATVNSTPKSQLLSWTGSDERSQVAKPTGKPTPCADVDIGECFASFIVDTVVSQDLDSQSLIPDHGEPDSPSYTQLATLVAGCSDVHTSAKERRVQPNKPYTIRQIRKLLAGFKVQSSAKTSLMGAPPKELLGAATQRSKPHRDTFPIKPRQHAQETKQTQDCPSSNSKPDRPKDGNRSAVTPFQGLAAMPPEGSTRAGILPGCPSLDRGSREAEVGFETRTFRSVNSRSNHLSHLAPSRR
ncbi:hypothetical protein CLF_110705 [Clonorchis sinensis]|uniref:Uncharacterized protein n=1 Tax=Clonorchis sinensis TaxID=79923 RepID=G7YTT1_CLOSI|nr:hypothetical protein CLF_110705 [Clonorchis sinensis]